MVSSGDQEALRAQIQELLKEMSGELKQLQAQLAAANNLPKPEAGTSTDPDLYESPTALDPATGGPLPIQLQTDATQTKGQRSAGGVGQPSSQAVSAAPQASAEDAELTDEPVEESSASRQPVPPEYRSVFDRLRNRDNATTP